jgi:hypothetical protein
MKELSEEPNEDRRNRQGYSSESSLSNEYEYGNDDFDDTDF